MAKQRESQEWTDPKTDETYIFNDNGHGDLYNAELDKFLVFKGRARFTVSTITHKDESMTMNRETFQKNTQLNKGVYEEGYETNEDGSVFVKKEDVNKEIKKEDELFGEKRLDQIKNAINSNELTQDEENNALKTFREISGKRIDEVYNTEDGKYTTLKEETIQPDRVWDDSEKPAPTPNTRWYSPDGLSKHTGDIYTLKDTDNYHISDFKDDGIDLNKDDEVELISEATYGYSNVRNLRTGKIIEGLSDDHLDVRMIRDKTEDEKTWKDWSNELFDRDKTPSEIAKDWNKITGQIADEVDYKNEDLPDIADKYLMKNGITEENGYDTDYILRLRDNIIESLHITSYSKSELEDLGITDEDIKNAKEYSQTLNRKPWNDEVKPDKVYDDDLTSENSYIVDYYPSESDARKVAKELENEGYKTSIEQSGEEYIVRRSYEMDDEHLKEERRGRP